MASNGVFEFSPSFKEFLPVYRDVARIWIGNGINTGKSGMLYAEYADGHVGELGSVSLYATAVENGYEGTERDWLLMIMGISNLITGSEVSISYAISESGTTHPSDAADWSPTPVFEKGKFTWAKLDLQWIDGNTTSVYFASYQGLDGQVESVNGQTGQLVLNGSNLPISLGNQQSIKEYVDENDIPLIATDDQIDALFSMAFFTGAAFITGRHFIEGDEITYRIDPLTQGAPMPEDRTTTIHPTTGKSYSFHFGHIHYTTEDIPDGETSATYEYRISEVSHNMDGVPGSTIHHDVSVTITDAGNGTVLITRSENFNKIYFVYEYTAAGHITFQGNITLNGRTMAAREFMVQIKEGNTVIADNLSTTASAATGQASAISFPPINYSLEDIGTHIYTVKQTSVSGDGVTIDSHEYTVTVTVTDNIRDAELEIDAHGTDRNLNFTNTYAATGSITFYGTKTLVHRLFRATDSYRVSVTSSGKLPSPAYVDADFVVGDASVDFTFPTITYNLNDMRNLNGGYDDTKTIVYTATETANIPGVTGDGFIHTITVQIIDNKHGSLITSATYSDGNSIQFVGTYDAHGTLTILGEKRVINRKFVASDRMHVTISTSNQGKLPYITAMDVPLSVGQNITNFNFVDVTYDLADLGGLASKTFSYLVTEDAVITGATNDTDIHSLDVYVADNYDGTLTVTPTYSDGNKLSFVSVYDATGFIALTGVKNIVNRNFKNSDIMSVTITANDGGKLPAPASISVPLTSGAASATFSFAQITYKITDLGGLSTKTFNYTVTETVTMDGTTPVSLSDTVSVLVTDLADGTMSVVPTYTNGNRLTFTNTYSASADLDFKTRCVFTNGNMSNTPFTVRITQVTGNNSTTQATQNVVLQAPVTRTANSGNSQDLTFDNIVHFVKNSNTDHTQNSYWFMIEEVLPAVNAQGIYNNVKYDTSKKWVNVSVTDNLDGSLNIAKVPAADVSTGLDKTFTNEQLANLTIAEVWTGDDNRLTTAEKNAFTYVITGPNSYSATFTYADMTQNSKVLEDLKLGEYVISQTNNTVENFNITTAFSVGGSVTNRVNLAYGGAQFTVTNNVNKLEATLNIIKVWSGEHNLLTTQQKNGVTFTVTGPKQKSTDVSTYSRTFTYSDMTNGIMSISQLTLGTYTVEETNYTFQDFDTTATYTVNGIEANSVTLADADNKSITVTDNCVYHKGTVRVTKQFTGITSAQKPANFNITNNYDASVFTYANADNSSTADGINTPYIWTITNVPVHTTVQFTEHNTALTDYDLVTTAVPANRTSAAVTKNTTKTVTFTGAYTLHTGTVKVTKLFTGITTALKPNTFAISNNYNDTVFNYSNADNSATADGINTAYEWTISNVPVHTQITFTEHNTAVTDYTLTASAIPANYTNAAVVKDTTSTVAITNAYTLDTGTVKVTKLFSGITAASKPGSFSITNNYNASTFTVANANNSATADGINTAYEWTITNVPVHTTIRFTEHNADVTGYTLSASAVPANYTSAAVTKNTTSTVAITNSYTANTGSIVVTKSFDGINNEDKPENLSITNDYNDLVLTYANNDNEMADGFSVPYQWTITNIPAGTAVEFTEANYQIPGYTLTSSTTETSDPVVVNDSVTVYFYNTYEADGE